MTKFRLHGSHLTPTPREGRELPPAFSSNTFAAACGSGLVVTDSGSIPDRVNSENKGSTCGGSGCFSIVRGCGLTAKTGGNRDEG